MPVSSLPSSWSPFSIRNDSIRWTFCKSLLDRIYDCRQHHDLRVRSINFATDFPTDAIIFCMNELRDCQRHQQLVQQMIPNIWDENVCLPRRKKNAQQLNAYATHTHTHTCSSALNAVSTRMVAGALFLWILWSAVNRSHSLCLPGRFFDYGKCARARCTADLSM